MQVMEQSDRLRPAARPALLRFLRVCGWSESVHRLIVRRCGMGAPFVAWVRACLLAQGRAGCAAGVLPVEVWRVVFCHATPRCLE